MYLVRSGPYYHVRIQIAPSASRMPSGGRDTYGPYSVAIKPASNAVRGATLLASTYSLGL
jgi:hypothetical protein